jgi:RNA recognition motif-containing protein
MDKEGKSKGLAMVHFSDPIEAVQSISMLNNQDLFERPLVVSMDTYDRPTDTHRGELPQGLRAIGMGIGPNRRPVLFANGPLYEVEVDSVLNQAGFSSGGQSIAPSAPPHSSYVSPPTVVNKYVDLFHLDITYFCEFRKGKKIHECEFCAKVFPSPSKLSQHRLKHT